MVPSNLGHPTKPRSLPIQLGIPSVLAAPAPNSTIPLVPMSADISDFFDKYWGGSDNRRPIRLSIRHLQFSIPPMLVLVSSVRMGFESRHEEYSKLWQFSRIGTRPVCICKKKYDL